MNMIVDTLRLAEDFKSAGFAEPQARVLADKFRTLADDHLVTKEYLDFKLHELRDGFDFKLKELRYSMTLSLGGLMTAILVFFKIMEHFGH